MKSMQPFFSYKTEKIVGSMTGENTRILIIPAQDGTEVPKGYSLTPIITLDFFFLSNSVDCN